jgi:hypothetical protein
MPEARAATASDLPQLLDLFRASEVSAVATPASRAERIWRDILARDGLTGFVSEAGPRIAATCMLITAPNLLRDGRGHAYLDNVVTHPEFSAASATVARLSAPRSRRHGPKTAIMSCCRAAGRTRACIASMKDAASNPACGSATSRAVRNKVDERGSP